MNIPPAMDKWVDLLALSQKRCAHPFSVDAKYTADDNFIGRPIQGYTPGLKQLLLMTRQAAESLCQVQNALVTQAQCGLLVLDAYRPQRAVRDFMQWSALPPATSHELARKAIHYPHIEKSQLFELGYVAEDSQHCYGHTVDVVLVDQQGRELDMGAPFDYMDELSHITKTAEDIGETAFRHRDLLSKTMQQFGFVPYEKEFWHFSYREKEVFEPMDVAITEAWLGLNV